MTGFRKPVFFFLVLITVLTLAACALSEATEQPSPEPPVAYKPSRPTPAPTIEPPDTVVDHINNPGMMPKFSFPEGSKLLEIWFPNCRDADFALLTYDGENCLIDCGDERAAVRGQLLLRQLGIGKIDVLYNSHLHHDHIRGLGETDDTAKIGKILICFPTEETHSGVGMAERAQERGIPVEDYKDGDVFTMGDGAVSLLFLKNDETFLDMNNRSAMTVVTYGDRKMLFAADVEKAGQEQMMKRIAPEVLKSDIIKYPHHAKSEMDMAFYNAVGAKLAIVTSVEGRGDLGQSFLKYRGLPTVYTGVKGMFIHLVTDGKYWLCEYVPITVE